MIKHDGKHVPVLNADFLNVKLRNGELVNVVPLGGLFEVAGFKPDDKSLSGNWFIHSHTWRDIMEYEIVHPV